MVNGNLPNGWDHRAHGHHEVVIVVNKLPESNKLPGSSKSKSFNEPKVMQ
jgi:hypothetical protein